MRYLTAVGIIGSAALAYPAAAQTPYNQIVFNAMQARRYVPPTCPLKGGTFRTASAGTYLKTATEGGFRSDQDGASHVDQKKYVDIVNHAASTALDELGRNPNSAAGWYYYGRAKLTLGDIVGADSAFTRLAKLSPDCAREIDAMRQKAWVPLVTEGSKHLKQSSSAPSPEAQHAQLDSALMYLRQAQTVSTAFPFGYYNTAAVFFDLKQYDSAAAYFRQARAHATDNSDQSQAIAKSATRNLSYIELQGGQYDSAVADLHRYLAIDSSDVNAKRDLYNALVKTGHTDEAKQIQESLANSGALSPEEIMASGVMHMNAKEYADAAVAFNKVLKTNPANHDALYDLANAYLGLEDGKNLVATSQRLLEISPLGYSGLQLLFNGYRLTADTAKELEVYSRLHAMPSSVRIDGFAPSANGAKLTGTAQGEDARDDADKPVPARATTLVFEFTDSTGAVVASQEVAVPSLAPKATAPISVQVAGSGIVAWRYHPK